MPSAMSLPDAVQLHIPAWKRLGLKLKYAQEAPQPDPEPVKPISHSSNRSEPLKRKREGAESRDSPRIKISKKDLEVKDQSTSATTAARLPITPSLQRKKSVTFTPETKIDDGDSIKQLFSAWVAEQKAVDPSFVPASSGPAFKTPEPSHVEEQVDSTINEAERRVKRVKRPKKEKFEPSKLVGAIQPTSKPLDPAFSYLKQYHDSKDTWKFNKVYQIHLLKHAFDLDRVPSVYIELLYTYIAGLKGGARRQLRDAAITIKVKDLEEAAERVAEGTPEEMDNNERREREFEAALNEHVASMTALAAGPDIGYEDGKLLGLSDYAMKHRMAKRMRAERILEELAQDAAEGPSGGSGGSTAKVAEDDESQKRIKMNDGSTQKLKRKRKQRTAAVDDSSSSESSSSSDSDSADNESDDEDDPRRTEGDDSSLSSESSSSSGSSGSSGSSDAEGSGGSHSESESSESD